MFNKIKRYIKDPYNEIGIDLLKTHSRWMSDKWYLSILFKEVFGYSMNWDNPRTFNEKLQWLKIFNRRPEYTTMVDKILVKDWLSNRVGATHIIPTLAVWDSADDIRIDNLPHQFVLKCNHDSGSVIVCREQSTFDLDAAKQKLRKALKNNFYWASREWPYKNVKRKIFAEKYLGENLQDYRIYCFNGEAKLVYSYTNISEIDGSKPEPSFCDIFDTDWNPLPYRQNSSARGNIPKPRYLAEMIEISELIAKGLPHIRVDFYECEKLYIGELTFFAGGGMSPFYPEEWDVKLGNWITLPV